MVLVVVNQKIAISNSFYIFFLSNISLKANFHPNWMKNIKLKRFAIGFRSSCSKNSHSHFNPILDHCLPNISPHTNCNQNWIKKHNRRFGLGQVCSVGLVCQKVAVAISNSFYVVTPHNKFYPNRVKNKVQIFEIVVPLIENFQKIEKKKKKRKTVDPGTLCIVSLDLA